MQDYGTVCTQEENCFIGNKDIGICNQCKENYYLDYKDGKCKSNQENNEFKFCLQADEGKCTKCINNYKLGLDNKCSSTFNCEEADNGICIQCLENFYLGLDNRCSKTEKCIYSNDNTCLECDNNYYFNRANGTCVLDEGKFKNCKISNYAKLYCEECKRDYYLNKTDNLCYSNLDKNGKFYKCSKTDDLAEFCDMCIEGYYLGEKDKKCNINYGCLLSEDENRCAECEEYYCLDKKTGKCVDNEEIYEEEKKFYYKCNITNEEGTACEICDDGYILKSNGICKEEAHCIEKDEKGNCKKCKYLENDDFYFSFCLNQYFGCVEIYGHDKFIECNNNLDFYNCTKCEEGYKINEYGSCE